MGLMLMSPRPKVRVGDLDRHTRGLRVRDGVIDKYAWRLIAKKELTAAVLDTTVSDGWVGVLRLLGSHGIYPITAHWHPPQPPL
jgi:hypothetical protein